MKKRVLALILSVAMVFSVVACGGNNEQGSSEQNTSAEEGTTSTDSTVSDGTPVEGGSLVMGTVSELSGDWGRALWTNNGADVIVRELMDDYYTIVANQGGEYIVNPTIVKDLQTTENEDGSKTFTVTINEGLVYNNGEAITAKDYVVEVLFCASQLAVDLGVQSSVPSVVVGAAAYQGGEATTVSGLRLVDEYTFSIQIEASILPYYYDLTYAATYPMNLNYWFGEGVDIADDGEGCYFTTDINNDTVKASIEAARWDTDERVSAGPYMLQEFDKSALQATLVRNPNYAGNFEGQKPYIEKLVIVRAEDETWLDAMKTGAIEFFDQVTDGDDINSALDLVDTGAFDYVQFDRPGYGKLQFACDFGPTQFVAVRQAVAYLLDRNEFANQFCMGWGGTVDGPYGTGLWQYKDSEEWLADNLNTYAYSYDSAVAVLEADGWVYDAAGNDYAGEGLRYKKVTAEEAGTYEGNVTLADGTILMPLSIQWASSEGNPVSELLAVMLAESEQTKKAGMEIVKSEMTFTELLNYIYRDSSQGDQYGVPTYGMFNLATTFTPAYDQSYYYSQDPDIVAQGWNTNFIYDDELEQLAWDMVYGVESDNQAGYLDMWQQFIKEWNSLLPDVPLYSNIWISLYPEKLHGYTQDSFWDFQDAILYAWVVEE